jgi:hypothetical protein
MGIAEPHKTGTFSVFGKARFKRNGAKFVEGAA